MGTAGQNHELFSAEVDEGSRPILHSIWLPLLVGAFLVYLITTNAAIGAAVACLKFGWEDFRTAIWLRRVDPDRSRGRNYFWLHLAYAFCKVTVAALVVMLLVILLDASFRKGNKAPANIEVPVQFLVAAIIWWLAFLLSTLATYIAIGKALWGRRKVWLSSQVHAARRRNEFPPVIEDRNVVERIVFMCALLTSIVLIMSLTAALLGIGPNAGRKPADWLPVAAICTIVFGGILVVKSVDFVRKRIVAAFPFEAWNELVGGSGAADLATLMRR